MAKRGLSKETLSRLLSDTHLKDLTRTHREVITLKHSMTLNECLKILAKDDILSAPVVLSASLEDNDADTYLGIVDVGCILKALIQDIISSVEDSTDPAERWKTMTSHASSFLDRLVITICGKDVELKYRGGHNDSLFSLIKDAFLGGEGDQVCHRIAMFNTRGEVDSIVTMSDVVKHLNKHAADLGDIADKTVEELGFTKTNVHTINQSTIVADALWSLYQTGSHCAALVDDQMKFVAGLSDASLRGLNSENLDRILDSCGDFVKNDDRHGSCLPSTTFKGAIRKICDERLHRLYIVSETKQVVGVLSLTDILKQVVA